MGFRVDFLVFFWPLEVPLSHLHEAELSVRAALERLEELWSLGAFALMGELLAPTRPAQRGQARVARGVRCARSAESYSDPKRQHEGGACADLGTRHGCACPSFFACGCFRRPKGVLEHVSKAQEHLQQSWPLPCDPLVASELLWVQFLHGLLQLFGQYLVEFCATCPRGGGGGGTPEERPGPVTIPRGTPMGVSVCIALFGF